MPIATGGANLRNLPEHTEACALVLVVFVHSGGGDSAVLGVFAELPKTLEARRSPAVVKKLPLRRSTSSHPSLDPLPSGGQGYSRWNLSRFGPHFSASLRAKLTPGPASGQAGKRHRAHQKEPLSTNSETVPKFAGASDTTSR